MPYASDKQRKFMHAQHPQIAAKWDKESRPLMKAEQAGHGRRTKSDLTGGAAEATAGAGLGALVLNHKPLTNQALKLNDIVAGRRKEKWTGTYGMGVRGEKVNKPLGVAQPPRPRAAGQTSGAARRAAKKGSFAARRRLVGHLNQVTATQRKADRIIRGPGKFTAMGAGIAAAAPLVYHGGHRFARGLDRVEQLESPKKVRKDDTKNTQDWNRAAAGGAVGGGAYVGAGFAGKPYEKRLRRKIQTGMGDPDRATHFRRVEAEHGKLMGMTGKEKLGDPKFVKFYRKYPKELPGSKYRRVLSYTHGGKTQLIGAGITTAAVGGTAVALGRRRDKQKGALVRKDDIPAMGEYRFLMPNIRQEIEWGIPEERRNPISPVQMLAASNLAAAGYTDVKRHWPIGKKKRREQGMLKLNIAQQLAGQPFGFGVAS